MRGATRSRGDAVAGWKKGWWRTASLVTFLILLNSAQAPLKPSDSRIQVEFKSKQGSNHPVEPAVEPTVQQSDRRSGEGKWRVRQGSKGDEGRGVETKGVAGILVALVKAAR